MKQKDFRVELRDVSTADKPGRCKVTIYNDGNIAISAPEIRINTEGHSWKISDKDSDNFKITSNPDAAILTGVFTKNTSIPPNGHQEFTVTSDKAITKNSYPKYFYIGFKFDDPASSLFSSQITWENKPEDAANAEYGNAIVVLANKFAVFEDPFITFETAKGETLTDSASDVDIDPSGHGVVSMSANHDLHFMEFSGGSPKNKLAKGNRHIKLGVNRGSLAKPKPLELPGKPWVGFEINVAFIPC